MTDTYKILGQVESVAGAILPFYTVNNGEQAVSSSLSIVNTGETETDYSVFAVPADEYNSIFMETAAAWTQVGTDIDGEGGYESSGTSVSISGNGLRVAVGAPENDDSGPNAGHVRVYERSGSAWVQLGQDIDGGPFDRSGTSVSLSADGSTVAVGSPTGNGYAGRVRIYYWSGYELGWQQVGTVLDGEDYYDESGISVSLSADGGTVAIGARYADNRGHVRVYGLLGGSWFQLGADIDGEYLGDTAGSSVSLSADGLRVAIGAPSNEGTSTLAGHVRVYEWSDSSWVQVGADIDGYEFYGRSGWAVSLSANGSRVAIGAPYEDSVYSDSGRVRVYEWSGTAWVQVGLYIAGEANDNYSGISVSLSADGSRVAIGAPGNGGYAGHVRVYEWSGSTWTQAGMDIDGESSGDYDRSGESVSISADGSCVAIGASQNTGNGYLSGHVRVYDWNDYQLDIVLQNKHALIKSKSILAGVHDEIVGAIQLSAGDSLLVSSASADVVFNMYGVETV